MVHMLPLSFWLLVIAALFGSALAALHLQRDRAPPSWLFGALHGLLGIVGFVALLLALPGSPRGEAMGVSSFGRIAMVLLTMALLLALPILVARVRRRRIPNVVVGVHATVAVSGVVILAAYTLIG